jgi:serine/threonine protein kinase
MQHFNLDNTDHLNDAILVQNLGDGGCGVLELYQCKQVYKNVVCNKYFVVKRIKPTYNYYGLKKKESGTSLAKFYQEYNIGILLHHRNIRRTFDIDVDNNSIIFEYCYGLDLLDYANEYKSANTRPLTRLFGKILDAVEYLHTVGVAHLDLKLENVMYDPENDTIKLIDFGEAVLLEDKTDFIGPRGTLQYMCPEMLEFSTFNPLKADLWCCGVILYNLFYNTALWEKATLKDYRYKVFCTSISKNILNSAIFPKNEHYRYWEMEVIYWLFKILLNPDENKRRNIKVVKSIFNLIDFENRIIMTTSSYF